MGALGLVLGERADAKAITNGEEKCVIESHFDIKNYQLNTFFSESELDYDDHCIIRREITSNGKSRAFINDTPVNLNQLKDLGAMLIDVVSQHETLALNEAVFQLSIVDAIANNVELLGNYKQLFLNYKKQEKHLKDLIEQEAKLKQDEDYYQFIFNELVEANLQENEQIELEDNLNLLSNAEEIKSVTYNTYAALDLTEPSLIDQLRSLKSSLWPIVKHNKTIGELSNRLEQTIVELKDISAELETISEKTSANPNELASVETRLQLLYNLQKKHRVASNLELLQLQQKLDNDLQTSFSLQLEIEKTTKELLEQKEKLIQQAEILSKKRNEIIPSIEQKVKQLLFDVSMPDAVLKISNEVLDTQLINATGIDKIEFLFAANKGSNFQPINKVASGGELSRLMLCVKSLISEKVNLPSIVFDEIDTGISGEAALKVSEVLKKHAQKHQVLAITHLPQIAAKADAHFNVFKQNDNDKTYSNIRLLNKAEQINEIAVMLSGNNPTEQVILAAKELINN